MKSFFVLVICLLSTVCVAQQQRIIVVGSAPLFPFDPLSGRYEKGSLATLDSYVKAWQAELEEENLFVIPTHDFSANLSDGYKAYLSAVDTTLLPRVFRYIGLRDSLPADTSGMTAKVVDFSEFPQSKDYLATFQNDIQAIKRFFSTPIFTLDTIYSVRDSYFGVSRLMNMLHQFQLESTGAELSLAAPPREEFTLPAGDMFVSNIYDMLRYDNSLVVVTATGAQVKAFLEEAYAARFYTMRNAQSDLVKWRTPYYLHDSGAGFTYAVNLTKGKGQRIEDLSLDLKKSYRVALNSFKAPWFTNQGCATQDVGQYRLRLVEWLRTNPVLRDVERWSLRPERWAQDAATREK